MTATTTLYLARCSRHVTVYLQSFYNIMGNFPICINKMFVSQLKILTVAGFKLWFKWYLQQVPIHGDSYLRKVVSRITGLQVAYEAYQDLQGHTGWTSIPGLNMTAQQLFFLASIQVDLWNVYFGHHVFFETKIYYQSKTLAKRMKYIQSEKQIHLCHHYHVSTVSISLLYR